MRNRVIIEPVVYFCLTLLSVFFINTITNIYYDYKYPLKDYTTQQLKEE